MPLSGVFFETFSGAEEDAVMVIVVVVVVVFEMNRMLF